MVPDKVAYSVGEKTAEILGGIMLAAFAAVIVTLMALGVSGGENIIMLVALLIIYGLFSVCGVYPQGTNIMKNPESASDQDYHRVRRGCIIAKFVLCAAVFVLSMPFFG